MIPAGIFLTLRFVLRFYQLTIINLHIRMSVWIFKNISLIIKVEANETYFFLNIYFLMYESVLMYEIWMNYNKTSHPILRQLHGQLRVSVTPGRISLTLSIVSRFRCEINEKKYERNNKTRSRRGLSNFPRNTNQTC